MELAKRVGWRAPEDRLPLAMTERFQVGEEEWKVMGRGSLFYSNGRLGLWGERYRGPSSEGSRGRSMNDDDGWWWSETGGYDRGRAGREGQERRVRVLISLQLPETTFCKEPGVLCIYRHDITVLENEALTLLSIKIFP